MPYILTAGCDFCNATQQTHPNQLPTGWFWVSPGLLFCSYACLAEFALVAMEEERKRAVDPAGQPP